MLIFLKIWKWKNLHLDHYSSQRFIFPFLQSTYGIQEMILFSIHCYKRFNWLSNKKNNLLKRSFINVKIACIICSSTNNFGPPNSCFERLTFCCGSLMFTEHLRGTTSLLVCWFASVVFYKLRRHTPWMCSS